MKTATDFARESLLEAQHCVLTVLKSAEGNTRKQMADASSHISDVLDQLDGWCADHLNLKKEKR